MDNSIFEKLAKIIKTLSNEAIKTSNAEKTLVKQLEVAVKIFTECKTELDLIGDEIYQAEEDHDNVLYCLSNILDSIDDFKENIKFISNRVKS